MESHSIIALMFTHRLLPALTTALAEAPGMRQACSTTFANKENAPHIAISVDRLDIGIDMRKW